MIIRARQPSRVRCGVVHYLHMYQRPPPTFQQPSVPREPEATTGADTAPTVPSPAPTASRHLYTMTVDQALSELYSHQLYRDIRTVQRWCKAGKLRAIVDEANGDRYLIDPTSLRELIATLLQERAATAERVAPTPRPRPGDVGTTPRHADDVAATSNSDAQSQGNNQDRAATQTPTDQAASADGRDEAAALKERVAALEREKTMLEVDKRVREELVDYLKKQFGSMLEEALTRTEELGALRAENRQLREMLPAPRQEAAQAGADTSQSRSFSPSNVAGQGGAPLHRHTSWSSDDHV